MKKYPVYQHGFSLVELMVASLVGLLLSYAVLEIYLAQSQLYKTSNSQDLIQSTENAIANLVAPVIRAAGFTGCGNVTSAVSNLNPGGPAPLGTINDSPTMLIGYSGSAASYTITQENPPNSSNANNWNPALVSSLVGTVQPGTDVLIILGSAPSSVPLGVTTIDPGSSSLTLQSVSGANLSSGQFGAVSDCIKSVLFQITGVAGTTLSHDAGTGILQNTAGSFPVNFQAGAQFVQIQQTAFFVGQGQGGQSALMRAILNGNSWTVEPLVPGINIMKVQYGIGTNGVVNRYVPANAVTDWTQVYSLRLGFLIEGKTGSGTSSTNQYTVLDTVVTVPTDNRLRHVFELTVHLRNAIL
ncbi:PilW family protein [Legionella worsleiensis]|uniref:Type IV fimbrial biogenesis PilW-like protein n=1 Tax=Legionella worsleiensis TaxID=45076 RepID=A0A0W1A320_9GAMM|nr:PilW family protein [Legionella worsleiensis]KTD75794.1 type IV fimbrial biogenesis PilW-like protein [Legionella worsleiensis]STY32812.1 type IV pilus assembly protein PilW [Legionella worsleiensis]